MIIELKGVEFENKGAELMLHAVLERIEQYWPEAEIALTPGAKASFQQRSTLGAWQKLSLRKSYLDLNGLCDYLPGRVRNIMKKWGIVTEADVDVIIDASGFSYSDQWGSDLRIRHAAAEAKRLAKRGKPYIFLPQAMGPFQAPRTKGLIKEGFKYAALVCARDEDTFNHLKSAGGEFGSLRQYKDFTNAMSGIVPDNFKDGDKKLCIIPNKNMVNPRNINKAWIGSYVDTLVAFANIAKKNGLTPFMLNHEGVEDGELIKEVVQRLGGNVEVIVEPDPRKVKGIIQASRLSICSRYHGCISALSSAKTCIGTSWSHKYERLYQEYQAEELLVAPDLSIEELEKVYHLALDGGSEAAAMIQKNSAKFKQETEQLWAEVKSIIDTVKSN